ncbi:hypothetical protein F7Q99_26025 [Streptomyces kaniharaensis]|uniref:Adenylate cyclase n=1 Tax=Streptomyces kaniharaensis TaxID=212423 RepID=A0A6N7L0C8_9ACTN|nr:hypothetical protein [Streptomyces kaniharaensis]MQS15634.1 hypothetical protein [Streptomyces kaniharaensis]
MLRSAATGLLAGLLCLGGAGVAFANPTPNQPGPPNQTCQDFLALGAQAPGHSSSSPGSPFDEPGFGSQPNGGTGGQAYNAAGAPSQYDVACFQQFVHSTR